MKSGGEIGVHFAGRMVFEAISSTSPWSTLAFLPPAGCVKLDWIVERNVIVTCVLPRFVVVQFGVAAPAFGRAAA